jgi:TRAP-type mannitol/chloroaromatic compound transport system permease small subunit
MRTMRVIDEIAEWTGRIVLWLIIPLMAALTYEVISRYVFNAPTLWAYESSYMLCGMHYMLGAAYTLLKGKHVRCDFFYENFTERKQGIIDGLLYLLFFFPAMILFLGAVWGEVLYAWAIREASEMSAWRPPIYPFKTVAPVAAVLLIIQGISEFLKCLHATLTGRWP